MKKILVILLCLVSHFSWGKMPENAVQKLKPDVDEDYFIIYEDNSGPDGFKTTLNFYDNIDLKGEPSFIVTPKEISKGKDHYKFSDSFQGDCKVECKYKFIPIDFVRVYLRSLALAVKDFKNGIARVEHKNKSYYFKFSFDYLINYKWRVYKKLENIKKILLQDNSYLVFVDEIKKCVTKKDLKCLEPFLDDNLTLKKIDTESRKRGVYDSEELCREFEGIKNESDGKLGIDDVPDHLLGKIKNTEFIWEKIGFVLDFSSKNISRELNVKKFGEELLFTSSKKLESPFSCYGQFLDIRLQLYKQDQKWRILNIDMSGFHY